MLSLSKSPQQAMHGYRRAMCKVRPDPAHIDHLIALDRACCGYDLGRVQADLATSERKRLELADAVQSIKRIEDKLDQDGIGLMPIDRAASAIGLSTDRLRHLCYANKVAHVKQGKTLYFRAEWLAEYIKSGDYQKKLI